MLKPSIFEEYSNLFFKGIRDFDKVVASRWNSALDIFNQLDPDKKAEAQRRLEICLNCPFNSIRAKTSPEFIELYQRGNLDLTPDSTAKEKMAREYQSHPPHYFTNRSDSDQHCCWCGCPIDKKALAMDEQCGLMDYNLTFKQSEPLRWLAFQN